ncbi:hypothetical protein [Geomesophilobacter sediminis]|uniref:DUF4194 domain-containing protein n=1 Tax=Geomesophilobacter sediminis TaxID=2798584 RepID=A0A8J7JLK7_9BACT|nr:hypothetical protein [Geomesophilobacter sediminis]MBJ6725000.1 hypothetical protein [Geomesophilobacter sediminis]
MEKQIRELVARLLAHQHLPRQDRLVKKALTDEAFRQDLDARLHACGLKFLDNPYAGDVTLVLERDMEQGVLGEQETWMSNTMNLDRTAIALLMVLWSLIILPKRQRQVERKELGEAQDQSEMFALEKPLETGKLVSAPVNRNALIADFGDKLGKATKIKMNLGTLARLGFIVQRQDEIHEGPLLDLLLDYHQLAGRVIDGALSDLLGRHLADLKPAPEPDWDEEELEEADV